MEKKKIILNYSKLRGRIKEKLGKEFVFAEQIGISTTTLTSRFRCETYFTVPEILTACSQDVLDIPKSEISEYFFTP